MNKFILPMASMLIKISSPMSFLVRKEPRAPFAHIRIIVTRKSRHRLETNPSFLGKDENVGTPFYEKLAVDLFTCDEFLLHNVISRLPLLRSRLNLYLITYQNRFFEGRSPSVALYMTICNRRSHFQRLA